MNGLRRNRIRLTIGAGGENLTHADDGQRMSYALHLTRTADWVDADTDPISWDELAPALVLLDPGFLRPEPGVEGAGLLIGPTELSVRHDGGQFTLTGRFPESTTQALASVAAGLGALLVGDDGETYSVEVVLPDPPVPLVPRRQARVGGSVDDWRRAERVRRGLPATREGLWSRLRRYERPRPPEAGAMALVFRHRDDLLLAARHQYGYAQIIDDHCERLAWADADELLATAITRTLARSRSVTAYRSWASVGRSFLAATGVSTWTQFQRETQSLALTRADSQTLIAIEEFAEPAVVLQGFDAQATATAVMELLDRRRGATR